MAFDYVDGDVNCRVIARTPAGPFYVTPSLTYTAWYADIQRDPAERRVRVGALQ